MTEKLSDNMTMEALTACLEALPDEMDWTELGALFDTILDAYEVTDIDGMKIGCGLAHNRANPSEPRTYDAGEVSDNQRARAALSLMPRHANGRQVINLICMVLESYGISTRHAELALGEAARVYKDKEGQRSDVMAAITKLFDGMTAEDAEGMTAERLQQELSALAGVGEVRVVELSANDDEADALMRLLHAEPKGNA